VIPRARTTQSSGVRAGALLVRVAAPPVEGAANAALVAFFAETLRVPRRDVRILTGDRGRLKRVAIAGVTEAHAKRALLEPRT
jgi:uncharacterized protein (TIGR00251 family)